MGRRIAITGASGMIGSAVAEHLRRRGDTPVPLVRRKPEPGEVHWDPAAGRIDKDGLEGLDGVVHLAGENIAQRWTPERKKEIQDSRVRGTRLLAETLAGLDRKPPVLVSQSAVGYYGDGGDTVLTEEHPPGKGFLAEVCQAWEAAAEPAREAGIRVVHPRPMMVLSADGPPLTRLLPVYKLGIGGPIGRGDPWWSWILREDFVRFVDHALATDRLQGPVNVAAPAPVRQKEFSRALADALGRPSAIPVPPFALKMLYGEMAEEVLLVSQRLSVTKLTGTGFEFHHPQVEEAMRHEVGAREETAVAS